MSCKDCWCNEKRQSVDYNNGLATNMLYQYSPARYGSAWEADIIETLNQQQHCSDPLNTNFISNNKKSSSDGDCKNSELHDIKLGITQMMKNLSLAERQDRFADLHGLQLRHKYEDPVNLGIWLHEMDQLIEQAMCKNNNQFPALRLAIESNDTNAKVSISRNGDNRATNMSGIDYIRSQRLEYLRAANWSPVKAIEIMESVLKAKIELFGFELLTRDLTMEDLPNRDLELWRQSGFVQIAKERDSCGRPIIVVFGRRQQSVPVETVRRVFLYLTTIVGRDEKVQRMGMIMIYWTHGQGSIISARAVKIMQSFKQVPLRYNYLHICYDNGKLRHFFHLFAKDLKQYLLLRHSIHRGSTTECIYSLLKYGIAQTAIPISHEGELRLELHQNFLNTIDQKEAEEQTCRRHAMLCKQKKIQKLLEPEPIKSISERSFKPEGGEYNLETSSFTTTIFPGICQMDPRILQSELSGGSLSGIERLPQKSNVERQFLQDPLQSNIFASNYSPPTPLDNYISSNDQKFSAVTTTFQQQTKTGTYMDEYIIVPDKLDVIMGRSLPYKKWPGNQKLKRFEESYLDKYEESDKFGKTVLSEVIVTKLIEEGSRFLTSFGAKDDNLWVEVPFEKARDKVAHDFRNMRRNAKLKKTGPDDISDNTVSVPKRPRLSKEYQSNKYSYHT